MNRHLDAGTFAVPSQSSTQGGSGVPGLILENPACNVAVISGSMNSGMRVPFASVTRIADELEAPLWHTHVAPSLGIRSPDPIRR